MATVPTASYDETKPAGTRDINLGDDDIRELKTQIREIVAQEHKFESSGQGSDWGYHTKVTHPVQATAPTTVASAVITYSKDVTAKAELFCKDEDGDEVQITAGGGLNAPALLGALPAIDGSALTGITTFTAGMIMLWSGSIATIPSGWVLCNGSNGTPDLRDRFVVGAGSTYAVSDTGGEATHTLTAAEMPSHTHTHTHGAAPGSGSALACYGSSGASPASFSTNSAGSGGAHENRPPYYALAYIMKT